MNVTAHSPHELVDSRSRVASLFSEAYSRLHVNKGFLALNFYSWFLFRRFLVVMTIIFFHHYPLTQIIFHIMFGLLDLIFFVRFKPFKSKLDIGFNIWGALFLLSMYSLLFPLYAYQDDFKAYNLIGWIMVFSIIAYNSLTILCLILFKIVEVCIKCKQRRTQK